MPGLMSLGAVMPGAGYRVESRQSVQLLYTEALPPHRKLTVQTDHQKVFAG